MLVWFALVLPLLLGMTGLVIDAGLLMAEYRHVQSSVDAAALAGANELALGKSVAEAIQTATDFVHEQRGLESVDVEVFSPPQHGFYAGETDYVEVVAKHEASTIFIHILPGGSKTQIARARGVAGSERNESIDGIIALDPDARPGLNVTGNGNFNVTGRVIVNSEGGGVDATGAPLDNGGDRTAAFVSPFALVRASEAYLVGGVNRQDRFENIDPGGDPPLKTGQLPVPDPHLRVPTPTVANGVLNVRRGAPVATADELVLNNPQDDPQAPNRIREDPVTLEKTMLLKPGIYSSISVDGGNVEFEPGIYVLASETDDDYSLEIRSGNVVARGVMFYNTTHEYDPITGQPDASDGSQRPNSVASFGKVLIASNLGFSPINSSHPGVSPSIAAFDGMLIYQRRRHAATLQFQGFDADLSGTVYAKWAHARLTAGGVFNSQFVVGSMAVPAHGDLTIRHNTDDVLQVERVFLVE